MENKKKEERKEENPAKTQFKLKVAKKTYASRRVIPFFFFFLSFRRRYAIVACIIWKYILRHCTQPLRNTTKVSNVHSTHANYFLTLNKGRRKRVGTMENATTLLKVAFSLDVRSFIDIPGVRCWNNKCLGDCFLSTVFLCTAFTIYRHPLHPENCFGKLLKPVLFLGVTLRQSGDFISFSQWQEFRVPRYRWCLSYSLERKHDMKCLNIVNSCVFQFQLCGRNSTYVVWIIIKGTIDNYGRDEKVGLHGGETSYK